MFRSKSNPIPLLACLLVLIAGPLHARGVGVRLLETREPTTGTTVAAAVLYPSDGAAPDARSDFGPYPVAAQRDAAIASGKHPLILLSHGSGGGMFGHHDLAEALARHGYIVAAPEHAGDSFRDRSGLGTDRALLGRAWQASATISAVLADPRFKPHVDASRIGAAGFSAGGYTALLLLGAKPDFSRFAVFCKKYPKTPDICDQGLTGIALTIAHPPATADTRVRAGFAMAPLSLILDNSGLKAVHAPVFLYTGARDEVLLPEENARRIRPLLPNLDGYREIEGAGHFVFVPPCSAALAQDAPAICKDPPGVDRVAAHRRINQDAVAFFDRTLK
ncbi:MAG TPA: prolyl oligopeptidase family serine peptidase [Luteimonas sp.]|nr:prolyl oligopeptidase family serine peptidase [Luteimonas sp.]